MAGDLARTAFLTRRSVAALVVVGLMTALPAAQAQSAAVKVCDRRSLLVVQGLAVEDQKPFRCVGKVECPIGAKDPCAVNLRVTMKATGSVHVAGTVGQDLHECGPALGGCGILVPLPKEPGWAFAWDFASDSTVARADFFVEEAHVDPNSGA